MNKYFSAQGARRGALLCLIFIIAWAAWLIGIVQGRPQALQPPEAKTLVLTPVTPQDINIANTNTTHNSDFPE